VVDDVTALPNRPAFEARLEDTFRNSAATFDTVLMLIDIRAPIALRIHEAMEKLNGRARLATRLLMALSAGPPPHCPGRRLKLSVDRSANDRQAAVLPRPGA
jgi:hypothetical protein